MYRAYHGVHNHEQICLFPPPLPFSPAPPLLSGLSPTLSSLNVMVRQCNLLSNWQCTACLVNPETTAKMRSWVYHSRSFMVNVESILRCQCTPPCEGVSFWTQWATCVLLQTLAAKACVILTTDGLSTAAMEGRAGPRVEPQAVFKTACASCNLEALKVICSTSFRRDKKSHDFHTLYSKPSHADWPGQFLLQCSIMYMLFEDQVLACCSHIKASDAGQCKTASVYSMSQY